MQFSRDAGSDQQTNVFLLGDELLVAPVLGEGDRLKVKLPRGLWTDLRTDQEYRGNQTVEIDAPPGRVPMFARNGSLFPISTVGKMELHYFPSLGGEFFLYEPDEDDNSQFHAAPAGEYMRVEAESKETRTYEWVLHHTKTPREVAEESGPYKRADTSAERRAGTWWHDNARDDLHILMHVDAGTDRIVNVAF
jgi:alpha-glucosidase (family GH31 glycosyl hydrolase)